MCFDFKEIIPKLKDKESTRLFLDFLIETFEDIIQIKHGNLPYLKSYDKILRQLVDKITNIENKLLELLKQRNMVNLNVNPPLLLDHVINSIIKE